MFSTSGFKLKQQEISTSFWWLPFRRRYRSSFKLIRSTNRLPIHPSSTLRNVVEHTPGVTEDGMADLASPESPGLTPQALPRDSIGTLTRPAGIDGLRLPCFGSSHARRSFRHWRSPGVRPRTRRQLSRQHYGCCRSVSGDLTSAATPATGGRQRFASGSSGRLRDASGLRVRRTAC